jgi:hypothetical protein
VLTRTAAFTVTVLSSILIVANDTVI